MNSSDYIPRTKAQMAIALLCACAVGALVLSRLESLALIVEHAPIFLGFLTVGGYLVFSRRRAHVTLTERVQRALAEAPTALSVKELLAVSKGTRLNDLELVLRELVETGDVVICALDQHETTYKQAQ